MPAKTKPGESETIIAIPAAEINGVVYALAPTAGAVALSSITASLLNEYVNVTTLGANGARGGNITCAIHDDVTIGLTSAETDNKKTLCDIGDVQSIKRLNYSIVISYDRDADPTSITSTLNLPRALFRAPDVLYVIAHRVGYKSTTNFGSGHKVSYYLVATDFPVPTLEDDDYLADQTTLVSRGTVSWEATL